MTTSEQSPEIAAKREALLDAADHLLPGDTVGPDFLVYLAVTKYGRGEFNASSLEALVRRSRSAQDGENRGN